MRGRAPIAGGPSGCCLWERESLFTFGAVPGMSWRHGFGEKNKYGRGGQNRFGIPFWLVGECTTHFRTYFCGWIGSRSLGVRFGFGPNLTGEIFTGEPVFGRKNPVPPPPPPNLRSPPKKRKEKRVEQREALDWGTFAGLCLVCACSGRLLRVPSHLISCLLRAT